MTEGIDRKEFNRDDDVGETKRGNSEFRGTQAQGDGHTSPARGAGGMSRSAGKLLSRDAQRGLVTRHPTEGLHWLVQSTVAVSVLSRARCPVCAIYRILGVVPIGDVALSFLTVSRPSGDPTPTAPSRASAVMSRVQIVPLVASPPAQCRSLPSSAQRGGSSQSSRGACGAANHVSGSMRWVLHDGTMSWLPAASLAQGDSASCQAAEKCEQITQSQVCVSNGPILLHFLLPPSARSAREEAAVSASTRFDSRYTFP